jgi:cytochrome c biogenesis protein CcmG/thiol:disulfide interchange protein DsbE
VLIIVWATWCAPCLVELPWIERLHERIQGHPDLALLTLNVDENPGVVEPVLRRGDYTFPVVFAFDYLRELWGSRWVIPCAWIVDAGGTVRREELGFDSGSDRWVDVVLRTMRQVAGSAQP